MGKLGLKARKFAKKNLQSVYKRQRKMKSMFKRKATRNHRNAAEESDKGTSEHVKDSSEAIKTDGVAFSNQLDSIFSEDDVNDAEDLSDSDGFLSEDSDCPYILERGGVNGFEGKNDHADSIGDKNIRMQITRQKRKLERLQEKDPKFSEFLEGRKADLEQSKNAELYSDEDGTDYPKEDTISDRKVLTSCTIDVWCWLAMEQPDGSALPNLLNAFRTACQYGIESDKCPLRIPTKEVFSKILTFVLCEADGLFRRLLGISDSCCQESILKLKSTSAWKSVRPLVKSYLRSCLFLLNQVTDCQILVFILSRLRASTVLFAAFPSLTGRLIKILVHLWVTGEESLSLSSFIFIRDVASQLDSDCLENCLSRTYNAFIAHCKFVQPTHLKHLGFLSDSVVELYSLDIEKSYHKVLAALQHLASILRHALKTKKKEELEKIYSWQYINCVNLWVKFITCSIKDHDLQQLVSLLIQVISGIAHLFPSPRYIPLRFKCVQMLNELSLASGVFIPVAALVFDCLECKVSNNADSTHKESINLALVLKVPKQFLKSGGFHEECINSAVQLLSAHFAQWGYHISFPEVATIPLILLKRFLEKTTVEGLRRAVKRLIDQVEQNSQFIQRKRDEVAFSPDDQTAVESFLQLEKNSSSTSFSQYYASVLQRA